MNCLYFLLMDERTIKDFQVEGIESMLWYYSIMLYVAILELWTKVSWWGRWKEQGGFGESDGVYEYKFVPLVDDNTVYYVLKIHVLY
jgi:hypothetical protein